MCAVFLIACFDLRLTLLNPTGISFLLPHLLIYGLILGYSHKAEPYYPALRLKTEQDGLLSP